MQRQFSIPLLPWSFKRLFNHIIIKINVDEDKEITDATINIVRGIFVKNTQYSELRHIVDVSVRQNLMEQWLNYGDVTLKDGSKSLEDQVIIIKDVVNPHQWANIINDIRNKTKKGNIFVE